jgi:uncharacterized membrane protein YphA (DoxX/SURF4 family)
MNALFIIGQVLAGLYFISSGVSHLTKVEAMTGYAKYKKLPAAKLGVILSGLLMLVAGAFILLGYYVDLAAIALAIFLVLAAIIFHNFWTIEDATAKMGDMVNFMKNIGLAGVLLMIAGFAALAAKNGLDIGIVVSKAHAVLWK